MIAHPAHMFIHLREITNDVLCLAVPGKTTRRDYRAVIQVGSIGFALMSESEQETVLEGFRAFLTRIAAAYDIVIHIRIEPYNLAPYLRQVETAARNNPRMIDIASDHQRFVLALASQRALLQRNFHIVVSADSDKSKSKRLTEAFDAAKSQLDQRCLDVIRDLERMGLTASRLKNRELANYYMSILHASSSQRYPLQGTHIDATDRPIQASSTPHQQPLVRVLDRSPESMNGVPGQRPRASRGKKRFDQQHYPDMIRIAELVQPSAIEVHRTYLRISHHSDEYLRGFAVIGYPRQVHSGWLDRLSSIDEPSIELCLHLHPLDSGLYVQKLTRKLTAFRGTLKVSADRGRALDPYISAAMDDIEHLREKLVRQEEQIFAASLYLLVRASTKVQLEERSNRLASQLHSLDLRAIPLTMRHEKALCCFLPGHDVLKKQRILDTSSVVTAFPFSDSSLSTTTGTLRGVAPNGSLIIMDEFSPALENANECKFAKSGAGKSYDSKVRILRSLIAGVHVCVIAPENEYDRLLQAVQGESIRLTAGSLCLNPFDLALTTGEEEDILKEKCQSLLTLFDLLLADKIPGELTQKEKSYLNRCLMQCYLQKHIVADPRPHMQLQPNMRDLYQILSQGYCGPDVYGLADRLQRFVPLFPEQTNINFENPLIVFNIRDLNESLRAVGLFLITEFVWSQMRRRKRPTPRQLLIDEAWSLLQFDAGGRFLEHIARRARKYYLGLSIITHDIRDCLDSEWGRAIMTNASLTFLMKQDSSTIDAVVQAYNLSPGEKRFLLGCAKGEGLYFAKGCRVPMKVVASPLEHRLATTDPQEVIALMQEQELSLAQRFHRASLVRDE